MSLLVVGTATSLWLATSPTRLDALGALLDASVLAHLPDSVAAPLRRLLEAGGARALLERGGDKAAGNAHEFRGTLAVALAAAAAAMAARTAYLAYRTVTPPRHARHLPTLGVLASLRILLSRKGFLDQHRDVVRALQRDAARRRGHPVPESKLSGDPGETIDTTLRWQRGTWSVTVTHPADVREILTRHELFDKFQKDERDFVAFKFLGKNVARVGAKEWKHHRRVVNPAFRKRWNTQPFGELMHTMLGLLDVEAAYGRAIDPEDWMQRMTLDALAKAIFSIPMDAINLGNRSPVVRLYNDVMTAMMNPTLFVVPKWLRLVVPAHRNFIRLSGELNDWLFQMIDAKTEAIRHRRRLVSVATKGAASAAVDADVDRDKDLLELMIEASLSEESAFSREDLRSNTLIFFIAGHDTTALALSFAVYLLGQNPDAQEKARREVIGLLGDIGRNSAPGDVPIPTNEQVAKLKYIPYVIKETMRLYPSVTLIPDRVVQRDHVMHDGTRLPAGSLVSLDAYAAHRDRHVWGADADKFRPERWQKFDTPVAAGKGAGVENEGAPAGASSDDAVPMHPSAHNFTWFPFGGGQRICLGQGFSVTEQKVVLAMMLLRYTWKVVGDARAVAGDPGTKPSFLLHSKGIQIKLTRRDTGAAGISSVGRATAANAAVSAAYSSANSSPSGKTKK